MGDITGIEWTDHTFNPWWGCTRISPACQHCYAETFAARFKVGWGVGAERRPASAKVWSGPLKWNAAAQKAGKRARVFCASMADVFEERAELDPLRERLWALIAATPWLDWQLLTKRIDFVHTMVPRSWMDGAWPSNVWIGTTVEDQARAEFRIPHLLGLPAPVRFLSCEPLLDAVSVSAWASTVPEFERALHAALGEISVAEAQAALRTFERDRRGAPPDQRLEWVIAGGESGPGSRPMDPSWARSLRDQCAAAAVPFFFKQWGEHDSEGRRVGKKAAGSLLDGVEHKAFPVVKGA